MNQAVFLITLMVLMSVGRLYASPADSIAMPTSRPNIVKRIIDYFDKTNEPDSTKSFDVSFIGGPSYSSESKLSIGLVAAGLYPRKSATGTDVTGQVNLYGQVAITGYYKIGIDGLHPFRDNSSFLIYDLSFESAPDKFWGIGYDYGKNDANETDYKRHHIGADISYMLKLPVKGISVGPHVMIDYLRARDMDRDDLWAGQRLSTFSNAVGLRIEYDTRDSRFNAFSGNYLSINQMFSPGFLGNKYAFTTTELTFCRYQPVWKGGILALNLHTRLTYGDTPWGMMSKIGGSYSMRGYWEGRYNDKCAADATLELRQHIYRRNGLVVWAGIGEVFDKPEHIFKGKPLPNFGLGYRWEFKKRVNVRIDYGFGRHQQGIVFNLNEAF